MRIYPFDDRYFDAVDTPDKAYWLGFITADGCVHRDGRGKVSVLTIRLKGEDSGHLELFQTCIGRQAPLRHYETNYGTRACALSIYSERMAQDLIRAGITPAKTFTCTPWCGDEELLPHYWRGVFDGDGSIGVKTGVYRDGTARRTWRVSLSGNPAIVDGFRNYVSLQGASDGCRQAHSSLERVSWGGTNAPKAVISILYGGEGLRLHRKAELARVALGP